MVTYTGHAVGGGSINGSYIVPARYTKHGINSLRINACGSADKVSMVGDSRYYKEAGSEYKEPKK